MSERNDYSGGGGDCDEDEQCGRGECDEKRRVCRCTSLLRGGPYCSTPISESADGCSAAQAAAAAAQRSRSVGAPLVFCSAPASYNDTEFAEVLRILCGSAADADGAAVWGDWHGGVRSRAACRGDWGAGLAAEAAEEGGGGAAGSWAAGGEALDQTQGDLEDAVAALRGGGSNCSGWAKTTLALQAALHDSGGRECCSALFYDHTGTPALSCVRVESPAYLLALPAMAALGAALFGLWYRRRKVTSRLPQFHIPAVVDAEEGMSIIGTVVGELAGASRTSFRPSQLAEALLHYTAPAAQEKRRRMMVRLGGRLGCQRDNIENQLEHLDSMLLSHLSECRGDYVKAIDELHASLLQSHGRWRLHTSLRGLASGDALAETHAVASARDVAEAKPRDPWGERPSTAVQLEEVSLFLLLWGEAANLRFMPEMLCFLFELARAHAAEMQARELNNGGDGSGGAVAEGWFLQRVVRPIYECVFKETYAETDPDGGGPAAPRPVPLDDAAMPRYPRNYDDWNEAFWSLETLSRLRTTSGDSVMAASPAERWPLLERANWDEFLSTSCQKTHRELRWWTGLLASNRRIFLLHALTFGGCFVTVASSTPHWDFNGWHGLAMLPPVLSLPPLCGAGGLAFEAWAHRSLDSRKSFLYGSLLAALALLAALVAAVIMAAVPYWRFERSLAGCAEATDKIECESLRASPHLVAVYFLCAGVLLVLSLAWAVREFLPQTPPPNAFDANLLFERRTTALLRKRIFVPGSWYKLRKELLAVLQMQGFWGIVWAIKLALCSLVLMPALIDSHDALAESFPSSGLLHLGSASDQPVLHVLLQPAHLLRFLLNGVLWAVGATIFVAETLMWYQIVLTFWGGASGIRMHGMGRPSYGHAKEIKAMQLALERLVPLDDGGKSATERQVKGRWAELWSAIVDDLYAGDLITQQEERELKTSGMANASLLHSAEARRRLHFFGRSLFDPAMPYSGGAVRAAGLTVLIPHYREMILISEREVEVEAQGGDSRFSLMGFLLSYFADEWENFIARLKQEGKDGSIDASPAMRRLAHDASGSAGASLAEACAAYSTLQVRKWASMRQQTLYRTVAGMMKKADAFGILLRAQLPSLSPERLRALVATKYRCVVAMQRYDQMTREELEDVEVLLSDFPSLQLVYIEASPDGGATLGDGRAGGSMIGTQVGGSISGGLRYFTCLVDGACAVDERTGRRAPRFRVEMPGHPILGDGKADNQNGAIPFTRGTILQMIDANQEGYLEEALKVCCALKEFEVGERVFGTRPAVIGFREHIFSGLGSLGEFAASSELVFGTLVQRTMAYPLYSRYHYGHPDLLSKAAMLAQGGVSKATRGLNLSEDVFTGMDAVLRGQTVVHREYFQVGKGRDMGFLSILNFFVKLSKGTARMTTTRQAHRLGVRLSLTRHLGFYYAHAGYYVGQLHWYHSTYGVLALCFLGAVAQGTGLLPTAANSAAVMANLIYGPLFALFLASSLLPLAVVYLVERGVFTALLQPLRLLSSGSPLFFMFQSRAIGHSLSDEFAFGGAAYLATGRGLGITRTPFHQTYSTFAITAIYPGAELLAFLLSASLACPSLALRPTLYVFSMLMPLSLAFSPALFNPHAFEPRAALQDAREWLSWLADADSSTGWLSGHRRLCAKKTSTHLQAMLLPSKEQLLALPLLLAASEAMAPYGWSLSPHLLLLALDPAPPLALLTLLAVRRVAGLCYRGAACSSEDPNPLTAGVIVGACLAAEAAAVAYACPALPTAHWVSLLAARYFCTRTCANTFAYAYELAPPCGKGELGAGPVQLLASTGRQTVIGYHMLGDVVLGAAMQLPLLIVALVPCVAGLHLRFLFNTTGSGLDASLKTQSLGRQSLQRSLEQYSSRNNSHATSPVTSRPGSRVGTPKRGSRVGSRGPDRDYRSRSGSDASFHDEAAQRLVANDDPPSPRDAGPMASPDRLFTPPSTDERPLMNHSASKGRSRRKR